jgi:hypothetical protein
MVQRSCRYCPHVLTVPMSSYSVPSHPSTTRLRPVHLVLRDGVVLDGKISVSPGQSLASFLGSRTGGWVNIVDAECAAAGDFAPHLVLQVDYLALAASVDGDMPAVIGSAEAAQRWVQLTLENDVALRGCLFLPERQRLSDYLHAVGKFLPVSKTTRAHDESVLGEVAINCSSIKVVRDLDVSAAVEARSRELVGPSYRVFVVDDSPVTQQAIRMDDASLLLLTPGPPVGQPDRRAHEARSRFAQGTPVALEAELVPLTHQQELGAQRSARHWLGRMAQRCGLAPPVPRLLPASPRASDLWRAICAANDMAETELAAIIAADCKVPMAAYQAIDARAVAQIPGKIARRLAALPVSVEGGVLHVATADPLDPSLEQQLRFVTKMRVVIEIAPPGVIAEGLEWWYPDGGTDTAGD